MDESKKAIAELEIARSRLTQEGGDLGKQVEEYESKMVIFLKGKKALEQKVEELKGQNEEEIRVSLRLFSYSISRSDKHLFLLRIYFFKKRLQEQRSH